MISPIDASNESSRSLLLVCGGDFHQSDWITKLASRMGCETREYDRLVDLPRDFDDETVAGLVVVESSQGASAAANLASLPEELAWMPTIVLSVSEQPGGEQVAMRSGVASQVLNIGCDATDIGKTMGRLLSSHEKRVADRVTTYDLAAAKRGLESLNERQHSVLRMMLSGTLNKKMAKEIGISIRTVENYRSHIYKLARVSSLAELVRVCVKIGYIDAFDTTKEFTSRDNRYHAREFQQASI